MPDEDPFHAHDRLFRAGLSNPASTATFLIDRPPPEIAARIEWSTLKLEPGSFADPEKLRALLRAAIVSDSLESFAASL